MSQKPQAASHMFWFFVLPCVIFLGWASYKLVGVSTEAKVEKNVFMRLDDIKKARSPGDRWQAAYELSQELQKMIRDGSLAKMDSPRKDTIFGGLNELLERHSTDVRLKRYLLLTLGQTGDERALNPLKKGLGDKDSEVKFFSAWGYLEVLGKNAPLATPENLAEIEKWLNDGDTSLRKIAATFLVQRPGKAYVPAVEKQLKDQDREVRWNAAVALASIKEDSATPVLGEIFELEGLRAVEFKSPKDLEQMLDTATIAAAKLGDEGILNKIETLRLQAKAEEKTPEGRAILRGLAKAP